MVQSFFVLQQEKEEKNIHLFSVVFFLVTHYSFNENNTFLALGMQDSTLTFVGYLTVNKLVKNTFRQYF